MSDIENSSESENDLCEAVNNLNLSTTVKGKITETNQRKPKLVALGYQYRVSGLIVDGRSIIWRCYFVVLQRKTQAIYTRMLKAIKLFGY